MEILNTLNTTLQNITDPEKGAKVSVNVSLEPSAYVYVAAAIIGGMVIGSILMKLINKAIA